jgi:hypothetical protein
MASPDNGLIFFVGSTAGKKKSDRFALIVQRCDGGGRAVSFLQGLPHTVGT